MKLAFSEIKEIASLVNDWRAVVENIRDNDPDFEIENYRFIDADEIDEIQRDELAGDTYMLGCFSDWFIADITGLPVESVTKAQNSESFEILGELMLKDIDEVQEKFALYDGYGHHFAHYDGSEQEIGNYYAFRVN